MLIMNQVFVPKLNFNYVGVQIDSQITTSMAQCQRQLVDQVKKYVSAHQGLYIVLEGVDLTGKTSQCYNLLTLLRDNTDLSIRLVEEPGGTPRADEIRQLVKDKNSHLSPMGNVQLFTEARVELMEQVISPALAGGEVVISSRNWWSTLAYQGYGQGVDVNKIVRLTEQSMSERYLYPDASAILLVSDEVQQQRRASRGDQAGGDAFEDNDDASFMVKVADGYRRVARRLDIPIVNANASEMEVFDRVLDALMTVGFAS